MALTEDDRKAFAEVAEYIRRISTEIHAMAFYSAKHEACAADVRKVSQRACSVLDKFEVLVDRLNKSNPEEPMIREGEHEDPDAPIPYTPTDLANGFAINGGNG